MRDDEAGKVELQLAVEEEVEVEGAGPVALPSRYTARLGLQSPEEVDKPERGQESPPGCDRIQEVRLRRPADGSGAEEGGERQARDVTGEAREGAAKRPLR